jgi:pimeloyl-ACP methyl ester carboxylesterase
MQIREYCGRARVVVPVHTFAEPTLSRLDVPALVVCGEHDPFFPVIQAERTVASARHGRLIASHGAGRLLPDERPNELACDLGQLARDSAL